MLNARIRKVSVQKAVPIYSIGNPGNLTYDYTIMEVKLMISREYLITSQFSQKNYPLQKNQ